MARTLTALDNAIGVLGDAGASGTGLADRGAHGGPDHVQMAGYLMHQLTKMSKNAWKVRESKLSEGMRGQCIRNAMNA